MRKTKRALFLSAVSMLLCLSMFIGTTFAWFTDSVSSVNNIIKSGNLDIEVEYSLDGTTFNTLGEASIFPEHDLWEPGFTRVVALSIKNVGSLAAKLDVATNVASEVKGTNVFDEEFKLSDYLKVYTGDTFVSDRDLTGMTESAFGVSLFDPATEVGLLPGESKTVVIGITMPTTVGNEANHKTGTTPPSITFGITVNATQLMHEEDSFGNDYDKDATYDDGNSGSGGSTPAIPDDAVVSVTTAGTPAYYNTLQEAFDAAAEGDVIAMLEDVALTDTLTFANDVAAEFDLGGFTLSGTPTTLLNVTGGNLAIKNGSIKNVDTAATETKYALALSGDATASVSDVNIEVNGTGIYLTDDATITTLDANVDSYISTNGYVSYDAVMLADNARIDEIVGGEYYAHYTDGFIQAWFESNPKQMSENISYPINLIGAGASIGEISGGTFLGVMDKANNGTPLHVQSGKIDLVSGGYFGFWKKGLSNPIRNSYAMSADSIGAITGGTFEKGSLSGGFGSNVESIIDASGYKTVETGETVTVDIQFSTKVTTYTLNVLEVVAK